MWAEAIADPAAGVGRWFSWGPEDCEGVPPCMGRNVVVPSVGCAQGSWGSESGYSGIRSALASFGSRTYADYLVDALVNTWARRLSIDGFTVDVSGEYRCMLQTAGVGSRDAWAEIVQRTRAAHPAAVFSGEAYGSWEDVIQVPNLTPTASARHSDRPDRT